MKALTIWEPWASLIIMGVKHYETRGWSRKYRGPLAIHSAKCWTKFQREFTEELIARGLLEDGWEPFLGKVLGLVTLVGIREVGELRGISQTQRLLGDYSPGRHAWRLEDPIRLPEPIPHKGQQGLWTWMQ